MELDPGHKIDPEIQRRLLSGELDPTRYNVMMVDKHKDAGLTEARIEALGGTVESPSQGSILVEATLTAE